MVLIQMAEGVVVLTYSCGCRLAIEFNSKMQFRNINRADFCMTHVTQIRKGMLHWYW